MTRQGVLESPDHSRTDQQPVQPPALQKAYGLQFTAQRQMQPDFMYAAVASG
jgi:hypothetical protein